MLYKFLLHWQDDSQTWIVVVINRITQQAVTVGVFNWRAEAIRWAKDAIKRRAWRDGSELPDAYDKRKD
jgi:hypothetical protein